MSKLILPICDKITGSNFLASSVLTFVVININSLQHLVVTFNKIIQSNAPGFFFIFVYYC